MLSEDASSTPPRGGRTMKRDLLSECTAEARRVYKGGTHVNPCGVCFIIKVSLARRHSAEAYKVERLYRYKRTEGSKTRYIATKELHYVHVDRLLGGELGHLR